MRLDTIRLQDEIAESKLTLKDFAQKAQLPVGAVYRAIGGRNLRFDTAGKIATALGRRISELAEPTHMTGACR